MPGEDAVITWIRGQDEVELVDLIPLKDWCDYCVMRRLHVSQSRADALREREEFLRVLKLIPSQHVTK